jgi:prophage regulatory protein
MKERLCMNPPFTLLDFPDLRRRGLPFTRAWTMKLVAAGRFPAPLKLSARTVRWRSADVEHWLAQLPTGVGQQRGQPAKLRRTKHGVTCDG